MGRDSTHGTIHLLYMLDVVENETIYGLKDLRYGSKMLYDLKGYALLHEYSD